MHPDRVVYLYMEKPSGWILQLPMEKFAWLELKYLSRHLLYNTQVIP